MNWIIGSSAQDDIGSGTLLKWRADELSSIDHNPYREEGSYRVVEKGGSEYFCTDLMFLTPDLPLAGIEEMGLDYDVDSQGQKRFLVDLNDFLK